MVRFVAANPDCRIQIVHEARGKDRSQSAGIEIIWGDGNWPDLNTNFLMPSEMTIMCSPILLKTSNLELGVKNLEGIPFLGNEITRAAWEHLRMAIPALADLRIPYGPLIEDPNVRVQAAIDGQGFVMADQLVSHTDSEARLISPMAMTVPGFGYYYVLKDPKRETPTVRRFIEWMHWEVENDANK